jgi:hypothetical protein
MKLRGENRSTWGKTCQSVTLSSTNPTWTDTGLNPDFRGERPATNRLSHGTARNMAVRETRDVPVSKIDTQRFRHPVYKHGFRSLRT